MKTNIQNLTLAALFAAMLNSYGQPVITQQPTDKLPYVGGSTSFSVIATGEPPLTYQWRVNGNELPSRTNSSLSLSSLRFTDAGPYTVVVSNDGGAVTSQVAWLSVLPTNVVNLGDRELQFGQMSAPIWYAPRKADYGPIITGDGLTLIYESMMPGGLGEADLYAVTRPSLNSTNWSAPVSLGTNINSPFHDGGAVISPDGLSLYFDSTRPGGLGGYDIYVCTRPDKSSAFGPAVDLGPAVNGAADEGGGTRVSADNLTLVFTSNRPGTLGSLDIWMCSRANSSLPWEHAVHLPAPINMANAFTFPIGLSEDGLTMFFKSDRANRFALNAAGAYVTRRHSTSEPFGTPVLIQPILATGVPASNGVDLGALSNDGRTLWIDTFEKQYPDWTRVVQFSVEQIPRLEVLDSSVGGDFQLILHGREGATYEIQVSSDLQIWLPRFTINTTGDATLSDSSTGPEGRRFYRVRSH